MKLYLVHAGFYDDDVSGGFYESHTNYFVAAEDVKKAKKKALSKEKEELKLNKKAKKKALSKKELKNKKKI